MACISILLGARDCCDRVVVVSDDVGILVFIDALIDSMNEWLVVALIVIYFCAGTVKGTFGIGFPTAAISLTATLFDARSAIGYVIIPMCLINAWQIYRSGHLLQVLVRNWPLVTTMVASIGVFSLLSVDLPLRWLTLLLGVVTVMFALVSLWRKPPQLSDRFDRLVQVITGAVSGAIGGFLGIWAPPIIIYLTSRRVTTDVFVQTTGVLLFIGSFILLLGYSSTGMVNKDNVLISSLLLFPAIAGFTAGEVLRRKIPAERFQKLVLVVFLLLGLNIVRRAFII